MRNLFFICIVFNAYIVLPQGRQVSSSTITVTDYDARTNKVLLKHREEHYYNRDGKKIGEVLYNQMDGTISKEVSYVYNENNQLILRREILPPHSNFFTETMFKYCSLNADEPKEMKQVNSKGQIVFLTKRKFDSEGKVIREIWFDTEDTTKVKSYTEYQYNDKNLMTEELSYFEGNLSSRINYKYDESGRLIEIIETEETFTRMESIEFKQGTKRREEWMITGNIKVKVFSEIFGKDSRILKREMYQEVDGQVFKTYNYKYHCNDFGELIREETYENGILKQEKYFEYKYH